jgi:hypothetical protein
MSVKLFIMPPPHPKERRIIFENISKPGYDTTIETYLHMAVMNRCARP